MTDTKLKCGCLAPKHHRDCAYCGTGWADGRICGACKSAGIDGKVIPGTSGRTCPTHRPPKITAKQEGGDDGYCYVVRIDGRLVMSGLTHSEVPSYKRQALKRWQEQKGVSNNG